MATIFSTNKHTAFFGYYLTYEGFFSWFCYFVLFFLANLYFNSEKEVKKLFLILSIPVFIVSLFAIGEYFFGWQIMEFHQNRGDRVISFLGNPSFLGVYLVLLLPIFINFIRLKELKSKWRSYLIVLNLAAIFSLLATFSRGAWLGFCIAIIFLVLINFNFVKFIHCRCSLVNNKKAGIKLAPTLIVKWIIFFAVLIIGGWLLINNTVFGQQLVDRIKFSFIQNPATKVNTTSGRILLWEQTTNLIKDNFWFGVGPDNFAISIPKYFLPEWHLYFGLQAEKAHNEFLNLWATMGIGAMLSYLAILIYFFFKSISIGKNLQNDSRIILVQGILAGAIGYLVAMQFHYSTIDLAPLFWIFMGIAFSLAHQDCEIKSIQLHKFFSLTFVKYILSFAAIFLMCIMLIILIFSCKIIQADRLFIKGLQAENIDFAIENLEKAIEKNKTPIDYYVILSSFYFQKGVKTGEFSNFDKSIETLKKIIKIQPDNYRPYFILGNTYLEMASFAQNKNLVFQKAEQAFKKSLEFFPNSVDTRLSLGITYAEQEKFDQALTEFKKCGSINSKVVECYFNQGKIYEQKKDFQKAKEYYQKALEINSNIKAIKDALKILK
ncbi:O-antigen ligase family protein [Candidatus Kuenenbacteria bacterium]|nr:O-antigen ligase family protein [Candidatus Kuenenbacteria bacterium]